MNNVVSGNLEIIRDSLGYGDPSSARFLFVGIEEGGKGDTLDKPMSPMDGLTQLKGATDTAGWSNVWTVISKVALGVTKSGQDLQTYQSDGLFHKGDASLLVNLRPLSKKILEAWPYGHCLSRTEYDEWLLEHLPLRYERIRKVQDGMGDRGVTVCFGKTHWQNCIDCFRLSSTDYSDDGPVRVYPSCRTVFTHHFARGWGEEKTQALIKLIQEL